MSTATSALWASIVRTLVPIIVGWVVSTLIGVGIDLDPEFEVALTGFLTAAFGAVWYIGVRLLETYVTPKLGWLLGYAKAPVSYSAQSPAK